MAAAETFRSFLRYRQQTQPLSPDWALLVWTFSHPRAPHTNGVVERMVQLVGASLFKAVGKYKINEDVFRTGVLFAESVVNRRPLGYISNHPNDPAPLTPGMFVGLQFPRAPVANSRRIPGSLG